MKPRPDFPRNVWIPAFAGTTILLTLGPSCVQIKTPHIRSDPNQEHQERLEQKTEQSNVEPFISDHPELDEETKKELREGTITPHEAGRRLKK